MSLEVTGLAFGYPGAPLLFESLDLRLGVGRSAAVVAPSGRGKSTLLGLLGGRLTPSSGSITVGGATAGAWHGGVSWILQTSSLLPSRTALDNAILPLLAHGVGRASAEQRGMELLARLGLEDRATAPVRELSGGEAQRVGVARGLAWPGNLLLADEPTANLDQENAEIIAAALYAEAVRAPVVLVTHDPAVAAGATQTLDLADYAPGARP